ncbi:hypothetical protein [Neptuniibacter sp. QD34_54]|uniref:hypothetical protein n=1 Tax=Neptuniibacter sp. QD34_54 TaxID=3398208 RepID=UPI0039F62B2E
MAALNVMQANHVIIIIGLIYTLLIAVLFNVEFLAFGIVATIGALWIVRIARKRKLSLKQLITGEVFSVVIVIAALVLTGTVFSLHSVESFYVWLIMVPGFTTFGFAYVVTVNSFIWKTIKGFLK